MNKVKKDISQSPLDICLQHTGGISSLHDFLKLNDLGSLEIARVGEYLIPPVIRPEIVSEFASRSITVGSIDNSFYPVERIYKAHTIAYMNAIGIAEDDTVYYPGTPQEITGKDLWIAVDDFMLTVWDFHTKLRRAFPFIGGTWHAHKIDLINPENTMTEVGTNTHNRLGSTTNGSTGYFQSGFVNPSDLIATDNIHLSVYIGNNFTGYSYPLGTGLEFLSHSGVFLLMSSSAFYYCLNWGSVSAIQANTGSTAGYYCISRSGTATGKAIKRSPSGDISRIDAAVTAAITRELFIGAINGLDGGPSFFTPVNLRFLTIGDGLSDDEMETLALAIENFQTALGRNLV